MGEPRPGAGRGRRILVAEDETIIRRDLCEVLERFGFEVCEARDGVEAVAVARSARPDMALLDVGLPRLDGIEATRLILRERRLPIVMLTGHAEPELVDRAVAAGVFGYLRKPFREADLVPAIETAIARSAELALVTSRGPDSRVRFFSPSRRAEL